MLARDRTPADARPFRHAKLTIRRVAAPVDLVAWNLARARAQLDHVTEAYAAACRWLGEANRRLSPKHHGAGIWPLTLRQAWVRAAFRDINRTRAALRTARKTLAALEAV